MKVPSVRLSYFLGFLAITFLLSASVYLQMNTGLHPCPLCVLQRAALILIALIFLLGAIARVGKIGKIIIGSLATVVSLLGIFLSGRQIWLQISPTHTEGSCTANLEYMLQALPFDQVLKNIFEGSAECTQVGWKFLYLSLADWSLFCFSIFLIFSLWQTFRKINIYLK